MKPYLQPIIAYQPFDHSDRRVFVWIFFNKSTRFNLFFPFPSSSPIRAIRRFSVIRVFHVFCVPFPSPNLKSEIKKRKSKIVNRKSIIPHNSPFSYHLNRGSNPLPYLPSPFLSFSNKPDIGELQELPPSTNCLNIIEPRFEPQSPRGRLCRPAKPPIANRKS